MTPGWRSTSTSTACGPHRGDGRRARRPRRARLHGRRRGSTRPRSAPVPRRVWGSSASRSTPRPTPAPRPTREIGAPGAPARTLVVTAREDLEVARGVRHVLARSPTAVGSRTVAAALRAWTKCSPCPPGGSIRLTRQPRSSGERSGDGGFSTASAAGLQRLDPGGRPGHARRVLHPRPARLPHLHGASAGARPRRRCAGPRRSTPAGTSPRASRCSCTTA